MDDSNSDSKSASKTVIGMKGYSEVTFVEESAFTNVHTGKSKPVGICTEATLIKGDASALCSMAPHDGVAFEVETHDSTEICTWDHTTGTDPDVVAHALCSMDVTCCVEYAIDAHTDEMVTFE